MSVDADPKKRPGVPVAWMATNVPSGASAGTRVVLRHHNLPDDEQRNHHRMGWEMYLDRLGVSVRGGNPGPDPNA